MSMLQDGNRHTLAVVDLWIAWAEHMTPYAIQHFGFLSFRETIFVLIMYPALATQLTNFKQYGRGSPALSFKAG